MPTVIVRSQCPNCGFDIRLEADATSEATACCPSCGLWLRFPPSMSSPEASQDFRHDAPPFPPPPPPPPSQLPPLPPSLTPHALRLTIAQWLLCGLAGFFALSFLIVAILAVGRGDRENEGDRTRPAGTVAANVDPQSSSEQSAAGTFPLPTSTTEDAAAPNERTGTPSGKASDLLKFVTTEVAKRAEKAGAPPEIPAGQLSALGRQGVLDTLASPANLPKGMLPFLQGLDQLQAQHPADAIAHFDEAIRADENSRYYTARGAAYVLSEKMQQGIPDLERAMKRDPPNVLASRLTRLAWLMIGDQGKAARFHGHGGHAPIDFLITEVGVPYGIRAMSAKGGFALGAQDSMKAAAAVQKLPTLMRLVADSFRTGDQQSSEALFAVGVSQFQNGQYAAARRSFEDVLAKSPLDMTSRYYYARSVLESGDPETARAELTFLLVWSRFLPEAFATRALCAARQNDVARAERDLATAKRLDPAKAKEAEAAVANARRQPPAAGAAADSDAWDRLLVDSAMNAQFEDLATKSLGLRRSVDARRRRWDETYQDRLFELVFAARAQPGNADRLADVGEFLRENHRVIGLQVAPNGSKRFFRRQTAETAKLEIETAYAMAEEGLQANPKHARSWALKSAILLHTYGRLTEAERSAEYATQFDPKLIAGHMALSDCYKEYATRLRERAAALRAPKPETRTIQVVDSNGRFVRTDTETYYVPASPAELALAAECDRQAAVFEHREQVCLNNALAAAKGTKQEPFYQALLLFLRKDYQGAREWLERAVAQNPDDPVMRHRLASVLETLGLKDESTEEFARAVNLQQTTGEVWLAVAWNRLERTLWDDAEKALKRARDLDPSDARIAAYQSVVEESGRSDPAAATAAIRVALAQEEARARSNQTTYLPTKDNAGALTPEDVGLSIMLRLKAAKGLFATSPAQAAELYLATAANESRLSEWNLARPVDSAMLPNPDREAKETANPPPLVAILKNNRIYAGQALLNLQRGIEAAAQFAAAEDFANQLPAGGTAYLDFELDRQYVPFRVSSMPIYVKLLHGATLIQQKKLAEARVELQQVRFYLANRSQEQREMADDPIPAMYQRLAPIVGLR